MSEDWTEKRFRLILELGLNTALVVVDRGGDRAAMIAEIKALIQTAKYGPNDPPCGPASPEGEAEYRSWFPIPCELEMRSWGLGDG